MISGVAVSLEDVGVGHGRGQRVLALQLRLVALERDMLAGQRIR